MSGPRLEKRPRRDGDSAPTPNVPKKKRETISTACTACQKRKSKCDGGKPTCALCAQKHTTCEYPDDSRRTVNLRAQNQKLTNQLGQYEKLVQLLRRGSSANEALIEQAFSEPEQLASSSSMSIQAGILGTTSKVRPSESGSPTDSAVSTEFIPLLEKWQIGVSSAGQRYSDVGSSLTAGLGLFNQLDAALDTPSSGFAGVSDQAEASFEPNSTSSFSALDPSLATPQASMGDLEALIDSTTDPRSASVPSAGTIRVWQRQQGLVVHIPPYLVLPLSYTEENGDDSFNAQYGRVYSSFKAQKREELASAGQDSLGFYSFDDVDGGALLSNQLAQNTDTLSAFLYRLIRTFLDDRITILAFMHMQYRLMKWLIKPCEKTFSQVPILMKPISEQICIPHPCWIDSMPLGGLRHGFISRPETRSPDWLRVISTCQIRTSGDANLSNIMIQDQESGRYHLTPAFQEYIDNSAVWTFSRSQSMTFTELLGEANWRDH